MLPNSGNLGSFKGKKENQYNGSIPKQLNQKFWGKNLDISVFKISLNISLFIIKIDVLKMCLNNVQPGLRITNRARPPHFADEKTEDLEIKYLA